MIWTNLNPRVLMMLTTKYQSSGAYSSQEEDFKIFAKFAPFLPIVAMPLYFNKSEFPSPNDTSCQVWLNLVQLFLRRVSERGFTSEQRKKERSCLKEKDDGRRTLRHGISSLKLCSGELKKKVEYKWIKRNLVIKISKITFTQICTKWKTFW